MGDDSDDDKAFQEVQRALQGAKEKQAEAAKRTKLLNDQAKELNYRVEQLGQGEAALRQRRVAGELPPPVTLQPLSTEVRANQGLAMADRGPNAQDAAQRDADFDMAKRKQQAAEKRVRQQLEAQALNKQRLDLQRKTDELEAERIPMRRNHTVRLAEAAEKSLAAVVVAIEVERESAQSRIKSESDADVRRMLEGAEEEAETRRLAEAAEAEKALAKAVGERDRAATALKRLQVRQAREARESTRMEEREAREHKSRERHSSAEEVSETEELKYASDYNSGPASPMRAAEQVSTAEEDGDEEDESEEESSEEESGSEEESSEEDEEEVKPIETAAAVRARYKASLQDQEATLRANERAFKEDDAKARTETTTKEQWYHGELGGQTYRSDQMDAYKKAHSVANELISQVLNQIDDHRRAKPTIPQLEAEYANWENSHKMLQQRLERREAARAKGQGGEDADDEEEPIDLEGLDEKEEEEGRRFATVGLTRLDEASQWALFTTVINGLIAEEAERIAMMAVAERQLSSNLSRRILLGSVAKAAAGPDKKPSDETNEKLASMYDDMVKRRAQFPAQMHKHSSNLAIKWRGRRPKKPHQGSESSSSSDDEDSDADAGGAGTLALDETKEVPRSTFMRSLFVLAEGAYWAEARAESYFVNTEQELGAACTRMQFSPSSERTLLAVGTRLGGIGIWHVDDGPTVTLLRKLGHVKCSVPNSVLHLKWSRDATEVVAADDAGSTRIWSVTGRVPMLNALAAKRAGSFTNQLAKLDANAAVEKAKADGDAAAESAAKKAMKAASDALQRESPEELEAWQAALAKRLGDQRVGPGISSAPHLVVDVTFKQLFHAQLLDSTDEAEAALNNATLLSSAAAQKAMVIDTGSRAKTDKNAERRQVKEKLKEKDAAVKAAQTAADAPEEIKESTGGFSSLFGGRKKKPPEPPPEEVEAKDGTDKGKDGKGKGKSGKDKGGEEPPPSAEPAREWEDLYPILGDFHPSFTLMGSQPCVMVAMKGGLIAKVNRPGVERVMHSHPVFPPAPLATADETDAALAELRAANAKKAAEKPAAAQEPAAKEKGGKKDKPKNQGKSAIGDLFGLGGTAVKPALDARAISREYFTGHSSPVILLGFVDTEGSNDAMISLDASGLLLEWPYSAEHFASHGWYIPAKSTKINTALRMPCRKPDGDSTLFPPDGLAPVAEPAPDPRGRSARRGKSASKLLESGRAPGSYSKVYLKAARRWDKERVRPLRLPEQPWRTTRLDNGHVVRLYNEPKADASQSEVVSITRDGRGVLLRHATCEYNHKRVHGRIVNACLTPTGQELATLMRFDDVPEGSQLRLQTMPLANKEEVQRRWNPLRALFPVTTDLPTQLCVGPHMDVPASDYVFVLADNVVRIFSLGSGTAVRTIAPLSPEDAITSPLNSLAVSGNGKALAVGSSEKIAGQNGSGFWVYDLTLPQAPARTRHNMIAVRTGSARHGSTLPEQRIRESTFYLGTDRAGALNDHANVNNFMRSTANEIVDLALAALDPPPPVVPVVLEGGGVGVENVQADVS